MPCSWASTMPRVTPALWPKSSALTTSARYDVRRDVLIGRCGVYVAILSAGKFGAPSPTVQFPLSGRLLPPVCHRELFFRGQDQAVAADEREIHEAGDVPRQCRVHAFHV